MGAKRNVSKKSQLNTLEMLFKISVKLDVKKTQTHIMIKYWEKNH